MKSLLLTLLLVSTATIAQDWSTVVDLPNQPAKMFSTAPSSTEDKFLPPELAFRLTVEPQNSDLKATFIPAQGYYLYKDKITFKAGGQTLTVAMPKGAMKKDINFGLMEVYHDPIEVTLPNSENIEIGYQGCSEQGLCYIPVVEKFNTVETISTVGSTSNDVSSFNSIFQKNYFLILATFFFLGVALSLTPCVLPMIPILSGIIIQKSKSGFLLSLSYVLGVCLTYTSLGVLAGLSGNLLSNMLQNVWVLGAFSLIFIALGLSMFGLYNLQMPQTLSQKFTESSSRFIGSGFIGVFLMGMISALILSPCIAAPMAGALLYISTTRDVWLGGSALAALSLGMGVPLLAIGFSAERFLPKLGIWMEYVKKFFGFLLLATAVWIIEPFVPVLAARIAYAFILFLFAMFLWDKKKFYFKAVALVCIALGFSLFMKSEVAHTGQTVYTVEQLKSETANTGKKVMVDLWADWCVACREMESTTLQDARVRDNLAKMKVIKVDITSNPETKNLLKEMGLFAPPGIIFYDEQGKLMPQKVIGYTNADKFNKILTDINR